MCLILLFLAQYCVPALNRCAGVGTLECREACGGQGLKSENRIGQLKAEHDVQSTFEGDNNVLMQQVSKALLGDYFVARVKGKPFKGMDLEHFNNPSPVIEAKLTTSLLHNPIFQLALFR